MVSPDLRRAAVVARTAAAVLATAIGLALSWAPHAASAAQGRHARDVSSRCALPSHLRSGQIVVPVVVDFGGPHARVFVSCVVSRRGETGAEVLEAQAPLVGYPVPRYDASGSGLLCAIDGYPVTGCGTQTGSRYAYWAYWHGGKRWQYADDGPGEWTVFKGDVEGWRFEPKGSATPADPPPRAASSAAALESRSNAQAASGNTTTGPETGAASGPVHQPGSRSDTRTVMFAIGVALIGLITAAALLRVRLTNKRVT